MARGRSLKREPWVRLPDFRDARYVVRTTYTTLVFTVDNADAALVLDAVREAFARKRSDPKKSPSP